MSNATGNRREADAETVAIWAVLATVLPDLWFYDVLFCESLYLTLVPYIILQNCGF